MPNTVGSVVKHQTVLHILTGKRLVLPMAVKMESSNSFGINIGSVIIE